MTTTRNRQYRTPPSGPPADAIFPTGPRDATPTPGHPGRRRATRRRHRAALVAGIGALVTALGVGVVAFVVPEAIPGLTSGTRSLALDAGGPAPDADGLPTPTQARITPTPLPRRIPGLGPRTRAKIPAGSRQVIVTTGVSKTSNRSKVVLYQKTSQGWKAGTAWPARNGRKGWSSKHRESDLHTPIGVFSISDAGGLLRDVGTKLTYDQSPQFKITGNGMLGQPLEGSFDYVIAINYNRRIGRSPLDKVRPLGQTKGGGIWLHVRSDGPTQACVSLTKAQMRVLLKTLDPAKHPVIVMGDAASLRR